jgi:hypothetical protein
MDRQSRVRDTAIEKTTRSPCSLTHPPVRTSRPRILKPIPLNNDSVPAHYSVPAGNSFTLIDRTMTSDPCAGNTRIGLSRFE